MFKLAINSVRAAVRIQRLKYTPEALSVSVAIMDPYRLKALRKVRLALGGRAAGCCNVACHSCGSRESRDGAFALCVVWLLCFDEAGLS